MFNPLAQKAVKQVVQYLPANFAVVELGNQRFGNKDGTFKNEGVKQFYEALGAASYLALDVNEKMDAIIVDLNYDIEDQIEFLTANLVTNNGTSEHLFNQAEVFHNIHKLVKVNGVMLHILPLTVWINHGFYNYNPVFFRDLARANNYKILFYQIGNRWGDTEDWTDKPELFKEKNPDELIAGIQRVYSKAPVHKDVFNVIALQKLEDKSFQFPMQNKYLKDIEGKIQSV